MTVMLPRRLLSWLFALTLLFGQAAAFAHALSHPHADDSALPDHRCEVCIAQAQLGAAVPPATISLSLPPGGSVILPGHAPVRVDLAPRTARARAPPAPTSL